MHDEDESLAGDLSARLHQARQQLLERMARHGCHPSEGWRIHEELVNTPGGTAYVLRAVHRVHSTASELAVSVTIPS